MSARPWRTPVVALGIVATVCGLLGLASASSPRSADSGLVGGSPGWHGPAALWLTPDGATLFVACSKSGSMLVLDLETGDIAERYALGKSLVAMAASPDGQTLAVVDAGADELLVVRRNDRRLAIQSRTPLPAKPMNVVIDPRRPSCYVASRWSGLLSRVDLRSGELLGTIALDFSPHRCLFLPDAATLLAVDAFGGKMALVDAAADRVIRQLDIPGHNMRGMALSPNGRDLLITHMIITESAATTRDNVFWGITMTSNMRVIPISALLDASKNAVREAHTHFFGDPNNGAGDPEALAVLPDGTTLVCFAGVGEVAVGRYYPYSFRRVTVGARPCALAISPDQQQAYVANAHSDTISVIDIASGSKHHDISLNPNPGALTVAEEGERLFYDARLSLDGWFSCHSCHTDGHTNGYKADTFGDGSYGAPKNVLSLLGTGDTEPWAWNGSQKMLEDQVRQSLRLTMQPKSPPGERSTAALTAYLRTLPSPPVTARQRQDSAAIARGERVFRQRGCTNCHAPPIYTNLHLYDVGLDDGDGGNRYFSPPSLRGLAHSAPYLHDGGAKTLEDVLRKYQHRLRTALTDDDLNDLTAFLRSL